MQQEYKFMTDVELDGVLRQFIKEIEDIVYQITSLSSTGRLERADGIARIHNGYARIKEKLKEASHYTSLVRNENRANMFYTWSFRKAVSSASVHCRAKVNESNLDVILNSLHEAKMDLRYYLLNDYQCKK